jgi:GNAT superfamily N-acetyltransferase
MNQFDRKPEPMITILDYSPSYRPYFELYNREWLEEFFVVEPYDQQVFDNPERYILNEGGAIYFAQYQDDIVGTAALIPRGEGVFELSKMGITRKQQGLGLGKKLGQHLIEQARLKGAHTIMLDSNRKLKPAIAMYHKLGFIEIPTDPNSPYQRANIRMAMALTEDSWMGDDGIKPNAQPFSENHASMASHAL